MTVRDAIMCVPRRCLTIVVVSNIQQGFKTTNDRELGNLAFASRLIVIVDVSPVF